MMADPEPIPVPDADVLLAQAHVFGIRNLFDIRVSFERSATYLVGENNSGKSSLLLGIAYACGARLPSTEDLHRDNAGQAVDSAFVDLIFRSAAAEFSDPVVQRLQANYGDGPEPGEWFGIRTEFQRSRESALLTARRSFLTWDAATQDWVDAATQVPGSAMDLIRAQLVDAARDLTTDLATRGSDWGRVLADLGISPEARKDLEGKLKVISDELQSGSPVFTALKTQLGQILDAQSGIDHVDLLPLPVKLEELARSVDIIVGSSGRTALPLRLQGLGSRSLAALMVFHALCELRIGRDQGLHPHLLTLLEEPEAHLHPQAQAGVRSLIERLPGQTIVATHSSVLVAEAAPSSVRIVRSTPTGTSVYALGIEGAKKIATFRRYIERPLGDLFFARAVVFVDGTAERICLPVFLEPLLGRNPTGLGITIVAMDSMQSEQLQKAIDALLTLGDIPWLVYVDHDSDGLNAAAGCLDRDGAPLRPGHSQVILSGRRQLEQLMLDSGYSDIVERVANEFFPLSALDPRFPAPTLPVFSDAVTDQYLKFLSSHKGSVSELIAKEAMGTNRRAPEPMIEVATRLRAQLGVAEPKTKTYRLAAGLPEPKEK